MRFVVQEWGEVERPATKPHVTMGEPRVLASSAALQIFTPCMRTSILNARLIKGWTVNKLAEVTHTTPDSIKRLERGTEFPTAALLAALQQALSVRLIP